MSDKAIEAWNKIVKEFKPTEQNWGIMLPKMVVRLWEVAYEAGRSHKECDCDWDKVCAKCYNDKYPGA